jgi:hypothetical protein
VVSVFSSELCCRIFVQKSPIYDSISARYPTESRFGSAFGLVEKVEYPEGIFSMHDFQEAMGMSDEDMLLTFGKEYLENHQWQPSYA